MGDETDIEMSACESCNKPLPCDDLVSMGDVSFCPDCSEQWQAEFRACKHVWEPSEFDGDEGRYCTRCGGFIADGVDLPTETDPAQGSLLEGVNHQVLP